ncbi:MAG: 6-phosphogluconolactonase [Gammaproteobacteria bacterium]|jgi:6-phosphogluconolactonase
MSDFTFRTCPDRHILDRQLAEDVATILEQAVAERSMALLVVSGGSTPVNLFRLLSTKPLQWDKVVVTLADERWVPADDPDSNEKLVRENLLVNAAAAARFIALKTPDENPDEGVPELERRLSELDTFDLVILGMGEDGHTASLFPRASALATGMNLSSGRSCIAVDPVNAPHRRMSMTLPRLLDARQIFIHITGPEKREVLERADRLRNAEEEKTMPISAVLHQRQTPVTLYWAE